MQNLNVILVQTDLAWENTEVNLKMLGQKFDRIKSSPDIIILPEMFSTGFTMNAEKCAESAEGNAYKWMAVWADRLQCAVTGSILTKDNGKYFNRMYWLLPEGKSTYYDKRHLFRMGREHLTMNPGRSRKIVEYKGWKINLQVCYDLRFPVWSKNHFEDENYEYDVLIYIANWPEIRSQAYVLWANRVGYDGNGIYHTGDSMAVDPFGNIIERADPGKEDLLNVKLSAESLADYRNKLKVGPDWDSNIIIGD